MQLFFIIQGLIICIYQIIEKKCLTAYFGVFQIELEFYVIKFYNTFLMFSRYLTSNYLIK